MRSLRFSHNPIGVVALVSLVISTTNALRPYRYLDILQDLRRHHGALTSSVDKNVPHHYRYDGNTNDRDDDDDDDDYPDVEELYFVQRLDHFDPLNHQSYQQRYFYSNRYVSNTAQRTIIFLCVGGEGPGFTKSVLVDSDHCTGDMIELAKKLFHHYNISIPMYALEHRYYGKSYPTFEEEEDGVSNDDSSSPVTTSNLKYLSSRQALEDLAHFVQMHQLENNVPWVTFGGSYPGYMAGNARLKYPHLIYAAVSNSAPLDLQVDFPEYNERVGWDLKYDVIGGSQECFDIVKNGHAEAVALLAKNATHLAELFDVCDPETALLKKENQNLLLGDGLIGIYAQGNDPSCGDDDLCNIERLCQYMIDAKKKQPTDHGNLAVLVDVAMKQRGDDTDCRSIDFDLMLQELGKPVVEEFGWRSWLWQTCTEVGFYQTCLHDTCPYATHFHTVDQDLAICQAAYNITNVYDNVQSTKDFYGGLDISAGSRVLSVNGNVDPWSVLGLHVSPKYSLPVEMVPGASHHFWTHQVKETDGIEVQRIREFIYSVVMDWLGIDGAASHDDTNPTHSHKEASTTKRLQLDHDPSNFLRGTETAKW